MLSNVPDGGGKHGLVRWATDDIKRTMKITEVGGYGRVHTYLVSITDTGSFAARAGVLTPNQGFPDTGLVIKSDVTGTLAGTASYTVTASTRPTALVPGRALAGPGATAENSVLNWYKLAFPGTATFGPVTGYVWSRTYTAQVTKGSAKPGDPGCCGHWLGGKKHDRDGRDNGRLHCFRSRHDRVPPNIKPAVSTQAWTDSSSNQQGQLPADGNITGA